MPNVRYNIGQATLATYYAVNLIVIPATLMQSGSITHSHGTSDGHVADNHRLVLGLTFLL